MNARGSDDEGPGSAPRFLCDAEPEPLDVERLAELIEELRGLDPEAARIVELRFHDGRAIPDIARELDLSLRTVERSWAYARHWLREALAR